MSSPSSPQEVQNKRKSSSWRLSLIGCFGDNDRAPSPVVPEPLPSPSSPPPYNDVNMGGSSTVVVGDEKRPSASGPKSTSSARITVINDANGQVLGYMADRSSRGCCFNVQFRGKAHLVELPETGSSHPDRLKLVKPSEDAVDYPFLGIQVAHDADGSNERWFLRACDQGRPGSVFKGHAGVFPCTRFPGVGEPTSSQVWSIRRVDATTEELILTWMKDDGTLVPLQTVYDKTAAKYYPRVYGRPAEGYELTANEQKVRFILERCTSAE